MCVRGDAAERHRRRSTAKGNERQWMRRSRPSLPRIDHDIGAIAVLFEERRRTGALEADHQHTRVGAELTNELDRAALEVGVELTDEQQTQVRDLAIEAAKRVDNNATPQSAGLLELEKKVEAKTLDKNQRAQYDEIKDKNKLRSLKTYSSFQPSAKTDN